MLIGLFYIRRTNGGARMQRNQGLGICRRKSSRLSDATAKKYMEGPPKLWSCSESIATLVGTLSIPIFLWSVEKTFFVTMKIGEQYWWLTRHDLNLDPNLDL
jgi:hypothetical protein